MRLALKHLSEHPKSGVLRFRRVFPAELRQHVPEKRHQLTVTLRARSIDEPGAMERFKAASALYDQIVARASALASGSFDTLTTADIAFLTGLYAHDQAEWVEEGLRRADATLFREKVLNGLWWMEDEFRRWRADNEIEEIVEHWGRQARALLASQGKVLADDDTDSVERLCRALNDTAIAIQPDQGKRLHGEVLPLPPVPVAPTVAEMPRPERSFEAICFDLLENSVPPIGASTQEGAKAALRFFREANGHPPPSKITRGVVTGWIRLLAKRPSRLPADEKSVPLPELIQRYEGRGDVPRLTQTTLEKHVGQLAALWSKARKADEEMIPFGMSNPFAERKFDVPMPPDEPQELSVDELHAIFALPIFTSHELPPRGRGWACYWLPLLMLWTGTRPEEAAQLITDDVFKNEEGRWQLRITDEGEHPVKGKRWLKTSRKASGRRTFPLPKPLIDLGFVAYVESLRRAKEGAIFPKLTTKGKRRLLFPVYGEWWSNHLRENGIFPEGKGRRASRELRHNFPSAARASGVPEDVLEYIMGHGPATTNRRYGSRASLGDLVDSITYKGLDLSGVKPWHPSAFQLAVGDD